MRSLSQETSSVLARVKDGEEIDITEQGTVIARIIPARASERFRPPILEGPIPRPTGPVRTGLDIGKLREEERY